MILSSGGLPRRRTCPFTNMARRAEMNPGAGAPVGSQRCAGSAGTLERKTPALIIHSGFALLSSAGSAIITGVTDGTVLIKRAVHFPFASCSSAPFACVVGYPVARSLSLRGGGVDALSIEVFSLSHAPFFSSARYWLVESVMDEFIARLFWLQAHRYFSLKLRWVNSATSAEADYLSRPGSDEFVRLDESVFGT